MKMNVLIRRRAGGRREGAEWNDADLNVTQTTQPPNQPPSGHATL